MYSCGSCCKLLVTRLSRIVIHQMFVALAQVTEEVIYHSPLLVNTIQPIHLVAESSGAGEAPGVPGDMFACHADTSLRTVKAVKVFQMFEKECMDFRDGRGGEVCAGPK